MEKYDVKIPIFRIEEGKYLVGKKIVPLKLEKELMVNVGGGFRKFSDYIS